MSLYSLPVEDDPPPEAVRVSAIVLAYGDEPDLANCLQALRERGPAQLELVVVDNGCTRTDLDELVGAAGGMLVRPERNGGFAGGCNDGARRATGDVLVFVNSDAFVEDGCIETLVATVADPRVGVASACIVLDDAPATVNSVGNPVHVSMLSWAGGFGDPVEAHGESGTVTSATGCVLAMRRERWQQLGGFWGELFAYLEDAELSLRCHQQGLDVRYVAEARARHRYEFSRNDQKLYLLERNRLLLLATLYEKRTLLRLLPVLASFELLMVALSLRQGWLRAKLRGAWWILRNRRLVADRRHRMQRERVVPDADILPRLSTRVAPGNVPMPRGIGLYNRAVEAWCQLVLRR